MPAVKEFRSWADQSHAVPRSPNPHEPRSLK
jgi:hypothetical protein